MKQSVLAGWRWEKNRITKGRFGASAASDRDKLSTAVVFGVAKATEGVEVAAAQQQARRPAVAVAASRRRRTPTARTEAARVAAAVTLEVCGPEEARPETVKVAARGGGQLQGRHAVDGQPRPTRVQSRLRQPPRGETRQEPPCVRRRRRGTVGCCSLLLTLARATFTCCSASSKAVDALRTSCSRRARYTAMGAACAFS